MSAHDGIDRSAFGVAAVDWGGECSHDRSSYRPSACTTLPEAIGQCIDGSKSAPRFRARSQIFTSAIVGRTKKIAEAAGNQQASATGGAGTGTTANLTARIGRRPQPEHVGQ